MTKKFAIPLFLTSIACVLVNSLLIQALRSLKKLNTISFKYILLLSTSDICFGVSWIAYLCMLYPEFNKQGLMTTAHILIHVFASFSCIMVLLIALDRYIHMRFSLRYNAIMTKRRASLLVIAGFLVSVFLVALIVCARIFNFFFAAQLTLNATVSLCVFGAFILYSKAYKSVRCQTQHISLDKGIPIPRLFTQRRNPSREVTKSIFLIFTSLLICYTPYCIFTTISHSGQRDENKISMHLEYVSFCLVVANSSLNAIILIVLNRDLRCFLRNSMRFQCF